MMSQKVFSLSQVTSSIEKTLSQRYTSSFWVAAEMNRLGYQPAKGHAFPELVEKKDGKIAAQMRAFILKSDMRLISQKFLAGTGEELRDNIKILFLAEVAYSPLHGLSLRILDIDPTYTLGDLERERQDCIQRLKTEGLFDLNKSRHFSMAPKSIAVISSNTSKGFEDFLHTLATALPDIAFQVELFGAALQGAEAPPSIIKQLEIIQKRQHEFEAVAIIRGGGGDVGLSCYNDYSLAAAIAVFPLPVFTGVGHKANETIAELVSFGVGITPTAVGEIFVQRCRLFLQSLIQLQEKLVSQSFEQIRVAHDLADQSSLQVSRMALDVFRVETSYLSDSAHRLIRYVHSSVNDESKRIQSVQQNMHHYSMNLLNSQRQYIKLRALPSMRSEVSRTTQKELDRLDLHCQQLPIKVKWQQTRSDEEVSRLETVVRLNNPEAIFQKGYSLSRVNGKIVKDISEVKPGDEMTTQFIDGITTSIIQQIHLPNE
jgi:exodeoxyribonuclease VII large subunit